MSNKKEISLDMNQQLMMLDKQQNFSGMAGVLRQVLEGLGVDTSSWGDFGSEDSVQKGQINVAAHREVVEELTKALTDLDQARAQNPEEFTGEMIEQRLGQLADDLNITGEAKAGFTARVHEIVEQNDLTTMDFEKFGNYLTESFDLTTDAAHGFNNNMYDMPTETANIDLGNPIPLDGVPLDNVVDTYSIDKDGNLVLEQNDVAASDILENMGAKATMCLVKAGGENIGLFINDGHDKGVFLAAGSDGVNLQELYEKNENAIKELQKEMKVAPGLDQLGIKPQPQVEPSATMNQDMTLNPN